MNAFYAWCNTDKYWQHMKYIYINLRTEYCKGGVSDWIWQLSSGRMSSWPYGLTTKMPDPIHACKILKQKSDTLKGWIPWCPNQFTPTWTTSPDKQAAGRQKDWGIECYSKDCTCPINKPDNEYEFSHICWWKNIAWNYLHICRWLRVGFRYELLLFGYRPRVNTIRPCVQINCSIMQGFISPPWTPNTNID